METTFFPILPSTAGLGRYRSVREPLTTDLIRDKDAFTKLLIRMRQRAGLSRAELARRLGIKPASLKQYENGRRGRHGKAGLHWFLRLAAGCGCGVSVELPDGKIVDLRLGASSLKTSAVHFIKRA
jgi:hypothetical protein